MNDLVDRSFASTFDFEVLDELPGGPVPGVRYYPGRRASGQDGLLVRVSPRVGEPWRGMFAFGELGRIGASRILTMPSPDSLCVVARGAGYIVNAERPDEWEIVKSGPILDARAAPSAGVVVFADYTNICAYSRSGHTWLSARLAWDGLRIVSISGETLCGEYWDMGGSSLRTFELDLVSGRSRGGVE